MRLLLLGAPGSGKGTQSERLRTALHIPQLATGDMLRQAVAEGTELGKKTKAFMEQGVLVPDEVIIGLMRERISRADCRTGYILDGFPRTVPQAMALDGMLSAVGSRLDAVCEIVVPDAELLKRLSGRWLCKRCGASFHAEFCKPRDAGVCDACGGALYQRPDDAAVTVKRRLQVYYQETLPLTDYYRRQGILKTVGGTGTVAEIEGRIRSALPTGQAGIGK